MRTMIGDLIFDDANCTLQSVKRGLFSELTPQETKALQLLVSEPGRLRTYEDFSKHLNNSDRPLYGHRQCIRGTIKRIRKKMGIDGRDRTIRNRNGYGYMIPPDMIMAAEDDPPHKCPKCGASFYT